VKKKLCGRRATGGIGCDTSASTPSAPHDEIRMFSPGYDSISLHTTPRRRNEERS
jgi:hypothetical protein